MVPQGDPAHHWPGRSTLPVSGFATSTRRSGSPLVRSERFASQRVRYVPQGDPAHHWSGRSALPVSGFGASFHELEASNQHGESKRGKGFAASDNSPPINK